MRPSKARVAVLVLAQPGAQAFFEPVLPVLRSLGWRLEVNPEAMPADAAVVVTSTSYAESERNAIEWARQQGVRCAQLVDSWYDYGRRIEKTNGTALLPDEIWLFDEEARQDAAREGLPADRLRIVGSPVWESVAGLPEAPASRILLVDQPVMADMGRRLGYDENDFLHLVADGLARRESGDVKLFLAPHPRRQGALPNLIRDVEVVRDARQALRRCGTVIGMFSSLLVDAFLAGRRVVSAQPNAGPVDYCILSRLGLVTRVREAAALVAALESARPGSQGFGERFARSRERVAQAFSELSARGC